MTGYTVSIQAHTGEYRGAHITAHVPHLLQARELADWMMKRMGAGVGRIMSDGVVTWIYEYNDQWQLIARRPEYGTKEQTAPLPMPPPSPKADE